MLIEKRALATRRLLTVAILLAQLAVRDAYGQADYEPGPENLAARQWFQDAKFGLFVHWGVYSVMGAGEWVMQVRGIPASDYEKLPGAFNPLRFDPEEWVSLVKAAGMRYITITAKHHDGFAMFDSKVSDWDIVDRTPFATDMIGALAEECHRQGVKLFLYYSQLDWHHPDYYPRGRTGHAAGRPDSGDWYRYLDYMDAQLAELLTRYGEIGGIWFDGMWDRPDADWRLEGTYAMIHELQPRTLIGSNHHVSPFPGEDFQMFEKDLPGANTAGFNTTEISVLPLETAETINQSWGFNITDRSYKSSAELLRYLVRAAGSNANFLLNVGPMPTGAIQPEFKTRLEEMGRWLEKYGESIYGTRGGPIAPAPWGVTTQREGTVYLHVLDWDASVLALPELPGRPRSARLLRTGEQVSFAEVEDALVLRLPVRLAEVIDEIVAVEIDR
ncbi:MAG: alpha-L-fucosidase [Gemmatimonadota bacterium]|nr:MAG: alpha-L-fucosidase [Gemmatimonadota bacterium]